MGVGGTQTVSAGINCVKSVLALGGKLVAASAASSPGARWRPVLTIAPPRHSFRAGGVKLAEKHEQSPYRRRM